MVDEPRIYCRIAKAINDGDHSRTIVRREKVDEKAMIRNRHNRILHPALDTKREGNTNN